MMVNTAIENMLRSLNWKLNMSCNLYCKWSLWSNPGDLIKTEGLMNEPMQLIFCQRKYKEFRLQKVKLMLQLPANISSTGTWRDKDGNHVYSSQNTEQPGEVDQTSLLRLQVHVGDLQLDVSKTPKFHKETAQWQWIMLTYLILAADCEACHVAGLLHIVSRTPYSSTLPAWSRARLWLYITWKFFFNNSNLFGQDNFIFKPAKRSDIRQIEKTEFNRIYNIVIPAFWKH